LPAETAQFIRTAELRCQVAGVAASLRHIEARVRALGGYTASSELRTEPPIVTWTYHGPDSLLETRQTEVRGQLVVRVPAPALDSLLAEVERQSLGLDHRQQQTTDVAQQLLANQLRAQLKQLAAKQLQASSPSKNEANPALQALAQQEAALHHQLANLELTDRVRLATVTLQLGQAPVLARRVVADPQAPAPGPSLDQQMWASLATGWQGLMAALIWLVKIWPLILLAPALVWAYRRYGRRGVPLANTAPAAS
jgi:hypothetical protein